MNLRRIPLVLAASSLVIGVSLAPSEVGAQTVKGQKPATVAKTRTYASKPTGRRTRMTRSQALNQYNYVAPNSVPAGFGGNGFNTFNGLGGFNGYNNFGNNFGYTAYAPFAVAGAGYYPGYSYAAAPVIVGNPYGQNYGWNGYSTSFQTPTSLPTPNNTLLGSGFAPGVGGTPVQGGVYRPGYGVSGVGAQSVHGGTYIPGYGVIGK